MSVPFERIGETLFDIDDIGMPLTTFAVFVATSVEFDVDDLRRLFEVRAVLFLTILCGCRVKTLGGFVRTI